MSPSSLELKNENYNRRLAELEARLDRQRVLEAKLIVLKDELDQMKWFRKLVETRASREINLGMA